MLPRCCALSSLDITFNGLDGDGAALLALLGGVRALRCLQLQAGNPALAARLRPYRKTVVAALPRLDMLDDKAVSDTERRAAVAWAAGGDAAEAAEREKIAVRAACCALGVCACGDAHVLLLTRASAARRAQEEKRAAARANFEHITALRAAAKARAAAEANGASDATPACIALLTRTSRHGMLPLHLCAAGELCPDQDRVALPATGSSTELLAAVDDSIERDPPEDAAAQVQAEEAEAPCVSRRVLVPSDDVAADASARGEPLLPPSDEPELASCVSNAAADGAASDARGSASAATADGVRRAGRGTGGCCFCAGAPDD